MPVRSHGLSRSPTYRVWKNMKRRCYNPHHKTYPDYGGRGVRVYFDWLGAGGFASFLEHVGVRPGPDYHLDRIDPSKGYEPGNVRWRKAAENLATAVSAAGNEVEAVGPDGLLARRSLGAWAEHLGLAYRSLCRRLQRARTPEARQAVFQRRRKR